MGVPPESKVKQGRLLLQTSELGRGKQEGEYTPKVLVYWLEVALNRYSRSWSRWSNTLSLMFSIVKILPSPLKMSSADWNVMSGSARAKLPISMRSCEACPMRVLDIAMPLAKVKSEGEAGLELRQMQRTTLTTMRMEMRTTMMRLTVFQMNKLGVFFYSLMSASFTDSFMDEYFIQLAMDPEGNNGMPTEMEKKHVYDVYDRIAPHFSHTRYKAWPKIEQFLKTLPDDSIVYDIGCGNGKYLGVNPKLIMVGTDRSLGLLQTAQQKSQSYELFAADSLKLPIRDQACDAFISIAVIHHFSSDPIRLKSISEMIRITRVGGQGLIYVWAFEHGEQSVSKKKFETQDVMVPWNLSFKFEKDLENIDKTDATVNMEKKTVVYNRYYHVFKEGELESLVRQFEQLEIVESCYDRENWAVRVRRIC